MALILCIFPSLRHWLTHKKTTFHPAHSLYFEFEETFGILIATFIWNTHCTVLTVATATMNNYFNMRKGNNRHLLLLTTMSYVWWVAHIYRSTLHLCCVCELVSVNGTSSWRTSFRFCASCRQLIIFLFLLVPLAMLGISL